MKKVLILAYDFPPYVSVGALRPYNWYKYLMEFDIEPIVITRQWGNKYGNNLDYISPGESNHTIIEETKYGTIVRTPYKPNLSNRLLLKYGNHKFKIIRKALTAYYELMQFVITIGTKSCIYYGAKDYLKNNKVDLIIATGSPHILFKYASKLSSSFKIPWIADYRDPWSQSKSRSKNIFLKNWNEFFEKTYIKNASSIVTVSSFLVEKITSLITDKVTHTIPNGFNPEVKKEISDVEQNKDVLSFGFVGTIYPWHQLKNVLEQFYNFANQNPNFEFNINFFGINKQHEIESLVKKYYPILSSRITINSKLENRILMNSLAKQNVMLLCNDYCLIGTKIFDYLAVNRKILLCFGVDRGEEYSNFLYKNENENLVNFKEQEDVILKTNSGIIMEDKNHLLRTLYELKDEFKIKGEISNNTINTEQYSRKFQVEKLASIIKEIN